jgi:hypothetical protein
MGFRKRMIAAFLAGAMVIGSAFSGAAATTSPTSGQQTTKTAKYPYTDKNTRDHEVMQVVSKVTSKSAAKVTAVKPVKGKTTIGIVLKQARNSIGKTVPITSVGDGKKGVFKSTKIIRARISSKKTVTVNANAFKGSKIKKLFIYSKVKFKKNAFKGTKVKNPVITITAKKAKYVTAAKGAFTGLNAKAKIKVKGMNATQLKALQKKLKKAGFKGKVVKA